MFRNQRNVRKRPDLPEDEAPPEPVPVVKLRAEPDLKDFFFFRRSPIDGQAEALALVVEEVEGEGQATAVRLGSTGSLPLLARGIIANDEVSGTTTAGLTLLLLLPLLLLVVVVLANGCCWSKFELLTVFTR